MAANVQWFVERLNEAENQLNTTARVATSDRASRAIEVMLKNIGHNLEATLREWEDEVRNGAHLCSRIRVHDALRLLDRYNQLIAKSGVLVGPITVPQSLQLAEVTWKALAGKLVPGRERAPDRNQAASQGLTR